MDKPTYTEQLECAQRELRRRTMNLPNLVRNGKLTKDYADKEIAAMTAIVETLQKLVWLNNDKL